jgi:hypothetical protein
MTGASGKTFEKGHAAQAKPSVKDGLSARAGGPHDAIKVLQRLAGNGAVTSLLAGRSGRELDERTRGEMDVGFEHNIGDAPLQRAIGNQANKAPTTVGQNIVFDKARYAPATYVGRRLLAHELAHVVQQRFPGGSQPGPAHEREAESAAASGHISVALDGLAVSSPSQQHEREAERFEAAFAGESHGQSPDREASSGMLPPKLQHQFGARLGYNFAGVRVHDDAEANSAARDMSASAFTVGNDIYFRSGQYAPETETGRRLLAHELFHVEQQRREGLRVDRKIFTKEELEDMNPPSTKPSLGQELLGTDPAFEKFSDALRSRFKVQIIRRGTFNEQAQDVATRTVDLPAGVTRGKLDQSKWKEWSPPSGWATYKRILQAIESFATDFGELPTIKEVVMFDVAYEVNPTSGVVEPAPDVGASFGAGQLTIYSGVTKGNALPAGRSGVPYAGLKAKLTPPASEKQAIEQNITHELGHGVGEMAVGKGKTGPDPGMFDDYRREVGWTDYQPASGNNPALSSRLFDAGVQEVRDALKAGKEPPAQYRITQNNWNEGNWIEQPISQYATTNPGEDFAEAVMAFLKIPQVLKDRSPRRFKFLETRKDRWLPKKTESPMPGPKPSGSINPT